MQNATIFKLVDSPHSRVIYIQNIIKSENGRTVNINFHRERLHGMPPQDCGCFRAANLILNENCRLLQWNSIMRELDWSYSEAIPSNRVQKNNSRRRRQCCERIECMKQRSAKKAMRRELSRFSNQKQGYKILVYILSVEIISAVVVARSLHVG